MKKIKTKLGAFLTCFGHQRANLACKYKVQVGM